MRPQPPTSGQQEAESSRASRGVGGSPQRMPSWGQSRCGREDDGGSRGARPVGGSARHVQV